MTLTKDPQATHGFMSNFANSSYIGWMNRRDLLGVELLFVGLPVPNAIRKQVDITCQYQTRLGQQLKSHKLHLGLCLILQT
jgi:hypothetical protein